MINNAVILDQPFIRKAAMSVSGQDDMVKDLDSKEPARLHQLPGDPQALFARA